MQLEITQLYTYPIKSCAGIQLSRSEISSRGLKWDREWVVVDGVGRKLTQRTLAKMVLIQPALTDTHLRLQAPGLPVLELPLQRPESAAVAVKIWDSHTLGNDEGDEVAAWLSQFLGCDCRLLRVHSQAKRGIGFAWVNQWLNTETVAREEATELSATHFGFADGFPFLICHEESLQELNQMIQAQGDPAIEMLRFRPNIVVKGIAAYEEDYIVRLEGAGHYFAKLKNCTRCPMPNVDPKTAEVGEQPAVALYNTRRTMQGIIFGQNTALYKPSDSAWIEVGQKLRAELDF